MMKLERVILSLILMLLLAVPPVMARMGGDSEVNQIVSAAKQYARPYGSRPGIQYEFKFMKRIKDYAMVNRIPKDERQGEIETIILKKVNGNWVGQAMGTCLVEWERKVPELFR